MVLWLVTPYSLVESNISEEDTVYTFSVRCVIPLNITFRVWGGVNRDLKFVVVLDFLSYESHSVADLEISIKAGVLNLFYVMDLFEREVKSTDAFSEKCI
jgi:hypothetical protein